MLKFGSHLSVAGGMHLAVEEAAKLGFDSLQVFTANQRQWQPAIPDAEAVRTFRQAVRRLKIGPLVSHASYLINLATSDETNRTRSIAAFGAELDRCERCGVGLCVVHPGAHLGAGDDEGILLIAAAIDEVYEARPTCRVRTLLETTAGQGTSIGHRFEHLRDIIRLSKWKRRLGVCVDTCHIHAAGHDVRTASAYEQTMGRLVKTVGKTRVRCFHVNDSKGEFDSRIDRHAHIGQGTIGKEGFRCLVNDPRFAGLPAILETPKGENDKGVAWDRVNVRKLRRMVQRRD